MQLSKRELYIIVAAHIVAFVVIIASITYIYESPELSWDPSIRDTDGDGVPDKSDPKPFDVNVWGLCEGYINLTIYNNATDAIVFFITASSLDLIQGLSLDYLYADPYDNLTQHLNLSWWGGPVSTEVSVRVFGSVSDWSGWSWDENLGITNAQTTTVSLVCPDDFQLLQWYE